MHPALLLLALIACADDGDSTDDSGANTAATGTLALRFELDADLADAVETQGPARFVGGVYDPDDVTLTGVAEGAQALEAIDVMATLDADDVAYLTGPLPAETLFVLGFLDVNDSDPTWPDSGDLVTLPGGAGNKHTVQPDSETAATVVFDLVMG